ncbi:MAG: TolC family protein [Prolixibacteraceae bacterium]|jgi:outer membrane protein TolC|nr:TolC family protein [Prolixibacteraceae bacterium]
MKLFKHTFRYVVLTLCIVCVIAKTTNAQNINLSLEEAINMARQKSFESFRAKNLYLDKALNYQSYLKSLYPKVNLSLSPADYSRSIQERWDSESGRYKPYDIQSLTSRGSLNLNQALKLTGGNISVNSNLYRYSSFRDNINDYTSFISYPIRITYSQDFAKTNPYKWRAKTAPLEFEKAKKQYIEDVEALSIKAVELFFSLLNAEMNERIALLNKNTADTLYLFGQKKLEIGAITRDHYLQLQLKKVNAGIAHESSIRAKEQAQMALNNFLELSRDTKTKCSIPDNIPTLNIVPAEAVAKAFENNPDILALRNNLIFAEQSIKIAKSDRFSANFSTTIGLNQNQDTFIDAYRDLKDQQSVSFTISLPLLDWGDSKRNITKAELSKKLVAENARKQKEAIELEVYNMVNNFNIKRRQLMAASQADSISRIAYGAVQQQFLLGKASVLDINSSYNEMQSAQNNYLNSLMGYWHYLFIIRKLCLYDFNKQVNLDADFENMLDNVLN